MSTEIKPGQVWASMHNAAETATVRVVRGNEVWATDDQSGSHFVRASLGFRCDYELVKEPPAPLDPSKATCPRCAGTNGNHGKVHVRHGNGGGHNEPCPNASVEAFREVCRTAPGKVTPLDPSKVTVEITDWEDFRPGDVVVQNPEADGVEGAAFLVEREEPAPEPEKDLLAETIWKASRADEGTISATGANHVAAAIRNLFVVIDPATVDESELASIIAGEYGHEDDVARALDTVRVILAELGVEAS